MDDVVCMRRVQRLDDLVGVIDGLGYGQRTALQDRCERFPIHRLRYDVGNVDFRAQTANRQNVRMLQLRGPMVLGFKSYGSALREGQNLHAHVLSVACIPRAKELSAAAHVDLGEKLQAAQILSRRGRHNVILSPRHRIYAYGSPALIYEAMKRIPPGPGQESVWDYPRPPRLEPVIQNIRVVFAGEVIAASNRCYRVLETSHPPVYYIPSEDVRRDLLVKESGQSFCEFKGVAVYWSVHVRGRQACLAAWSYPAPGGAFAALRDHFGFYAGRVDACFVGDEKVTPQPGDFYGGWITSGVVGPFKGGPGTHGW